MATRSERSRIAATGDEHRVTPAELFFDLVFVYAITQVTALMAADTSALRLLGGAVVLAQWPPCCSSTGGRPTPGPDPRAAGFGEFGFPDVGNHVPCRSSRAAVTVPGSRGWL
ncbi:low temperature requirement protein A [Streptomyces sp. NPDC005808]|uniref:low temperature requirement protein A n=1 Tax=Streptomyces sp. NPDC005808 TaxID=3364734 RepID=UPI0036C73038